MPGKPNPLDDPEVSRWHLNLNTVIPALETGHIVYDTNILLKPFRTPELWQREALFKALFSMRERLLIPHQVLCEYERHHDSVRAVHRDHISSKLDEAKAHFADLSKLVTTIALHSQSDGELLHDTILSQRNAETQTLAFLSRTSLNLSHRE